MNKVKIFYYEEIVEESINEFLEEYNYELVQFQYIETQDRPIVMISYKEEE